MKNFEKYIDKIAEHLCLADALGENTYCAGCKFRESDYTCDNDKVADWLLEEYVEPCPLSHDEYVILKNLPSVFKWIVRHDNWKNLWIFVNKPTRDGGVWIDREEFNDEAFDLFNRLFQFVKWEDEPYEIAKLIEDYEKEHGDE